MHGMQPSYDDFIYNTVYISILYSFFIIILNPIGEPDDFIYNILR
jgi:hypothetical protein